MNNLGVLYENGWGVTQDYQQARVWFEKAVRTGDAAVNKGRVLLSLNGFGVSWSHRWGEKCDTAASAEAAHNLGGLYLNGRGVERDYKQASVWYEKAAAAGDSEAMNEMGRFYANGWGVAQDYTQASDWYAKGIAAGNIDAMYNMGICTIKVGVSPATMCKPVSCMKKPPPVVTLTQ